MTRPGLVPRPPVELTSAVRIRNHPGDAAELAARLPESFEDTLGVTMTA